MIKFEVDQRPPAQYKTDFSMINKEFLIGINHFDLPSLFSGKLHALLYRKYTKGRDYYDFIWYRARKITPNYAFLNQAIMQTEGIDVALDEEKLKVLLAKRVEQTNFSQVRADIEPFLINHKELRFFEKTYFTSLL